MHGTTKALIVAAVALQASANPVRLFERQASNSSTVPITTSLSSFSTSLFDPTTTISAPIPPPTQPIFPFPGSNGTYYICSFPSSNGTTTSSRPATTETISLTSVVTNIVPKTTVTDDVLTSTRLATTSLSVGPSVITPVTLTTPPPTSFPAPTPTEFTVVGPSTTAVIQCIQIPTGEHPHPALGNGTSVSVPHTTPTIIDSLITSSLPSATSSSS